MTLSESETVVSEMPDIPEFLKSERMKRNLSLREVSEQIRVSVAMLEALEEGRFERIGTALLIRSFVRKYCSALGIDPTPLLESHAGEISSSDKQNEGIKRFGQWSKSFSQKRRTGYFLVLLVGIVVLGSLYVGAWFWRQKGYSPTSQAINSSEYSQQDLPADLPEKKTYPAQLEMKKLVISESGQAGEGHHQTPEAVQPAPETPGAHRFGIEAVQKTWVQVTLDDKTTENVLLQPGDTRQWEAQKNVKAVIGNAGGVRMKWDGTPVEIPAKPGSVIRFTLPDQRYLKE